jgi:hypothetical protein
VTKRTNTQRVIQTRLKMILPHKLAITNDQLTSRAGLLTIGQLMDSMQLAERVDKYFPGPKSNRGFSPSVYIQTLVLMQHQGYFHLDEVRHLSEDTALTDVLGLTTIPMPAPWVHGYVKRVLPMSLHSRGKQSTRPC